MVRFSKGQAIVFALAMVPTIEKLDIFVRISIFLCTRPTIQISDQCTLEKKMAAIFLVWSGGPVFKRHSNTGLFGIQPSISPF